MCQTAEPSEGHHNVLQSQPQQRVLIKVRRVREQITTQTVVIPGHLGLPTTPAAIGAILPISPGEL